MSKQRDRMTRRLATNRRASAPPATPGYGTEDQDHPAHAGPDPEADQYENGDPSSWAEDPHPAPYPDGNPPADPGYDVEDQDHPAHQRPPRLPKSATGLRAQIVKKADKCIRLARHTLGKAASVEMVEDQALDYMDMPDEQLDATLNRLGGGFLAQEDLMPDADVMSEDDLVDELLAQDDDAEGEMACGGPKFSNEDVMAKLEALASDVAAIKSGNQNDPDGPTLAPKPETAEQVQAEAAATAKDEFTTSSSNPIASMFDQFDTDHDGFVTTDDWKGSKSIFASLDTDKDGIIARNEVIKAFYEDEMYEEDLYNDLDPDEAAMLAEMMDEDTAGCGPTSMEDMIEEGMEIMSAKKSEDEDDEDEDDEEGTDKEAAKKSEDEDDEADDEADDEVETDEVEDDEADKEASVEANMFSMQGDPMGLSSDESVITEDDSLLMSIFGGRTASDEDDEEVEVEDEKKAKKKAKKSEDEDAEEVEVEDEKKAKKKAKKSEDEDDEEVEDDEDEDDEEVEVEDEKKGGKKASQRPQPKKASKGVQKVGHVQQSRQSNEINELSQLWDSEPDVSGVFGVKSSS